MPRQRIDVKLKRLYTNQNYVASYTGAKTFHKNLSEKDQKRTDRKKTLKYLQHIKAYAQNRPALTKFKRRRVVVHGIDDQWVIDLADIPKLAPYNNGMRYIFVCIDVLSKFLWAIPMKTKRASETVVVLKNIIESSGRKCARIQVDKGNEFKGAFKQYCDENAIQIFHVQSELKACVAERVIRTILERVWRYMQHRNTFTYIDALPNIVRNYNSLPHRSTKFAPKDVNKTNEMEVWSNLYGKTQLKGVGKPRFSIGDTVLISIYKSKFVEKGYDKRYHDEIFKVDRISNSNPYMYYLKDLKGKPLEGGFYYQELSRIYV